LANVKVFRSYLKTPFLILLIVEVCILFFSNYSAAYLRFYGTPGSFEANVDSLWAGSAAVAIITPIAMLATGLYQGQIREGLAGILLRIMIGFFAAGVIINIGFYLFPLLPLSRGITAIAYIQSFFIIGTMRAVFIEAVDLSIFKKRILVYGAGDSAAHIDSKLRRRSDRRGFDIVGYVLIPKQLQKVDTSKLVTLNGALLDYVQANKIDEVVVATSEMDKELKVDELVNCKLNGIIILDILSFFEREAGQIRIDIMDPTWLVTSEGFYQSRFRDVFKRVFDITVSLLIFLVTLPFMILAVIAIWIEDGFKAPIFYSQTRVGRSGKHYEVYKFRSMRVDAEKVGEAVWATKNDSRVTRVGSVMRVTRVDEFPQIWNVLKGDMSFVGPRPERPQFVKQLATEIPYYNERHIVKPGVTGWAQLLYPYGSSVNDSYQKQLYDMYYVKNHSVFLDCLILLQTVEVVLFGKGAR
jgi:sugar transferase (PEP-CTERM system associated)